MHRSFVLLIWQSWIPQAFAMSDRLFKGLQRLPSQSRTMNRARDPNGFPTREKRILSGWVLVGVLGALAGVSCVAPACTCLYFFLTI